MAARSYIACRHGLEQQGKADFWQAVSGQSLKRASPGEVLLSVLRGGA